MFSTAVSLLLALFTLTMLWFSGNAAYAYWKYASLNATTYPDSLSFSYKNIGYNTYAPVAAYTFTLNENSYEGSTTLSAPRGNNKRALIDTEKKWGQTLNKVWFSTTNPSISSMERAFPYKQVVTGSLMFALWIYMLVFRWRL